MQQYLLFEPIFFDILYELRYVAQEYQSTGIDGYLLLPPPPNPTHHVIALSTVIRLCPPLAFPSEPGTEIKAMIFWSHGYAAHVNGPTLVDFTSGMTAKGFAVIAMDQIGHGYR